MKQEFAEEIAIKALGWLASSDDLLPVFLGATGARIEDLRDAANDPAFLCSVLDFVTMDDAWVVGFCDRSGLQYDLPAQAKALLAGPASMHWT